MSFTVDGSTIDAELVDGVWVAEETVATAGSQDVTYTITAVDEAGRVTNQNATVAVEANQGPTANTTAAEVRVTDGISPARVDASPSEHPQDRPISIDWQLPANGSGSQDGAQATWVGPEAGVYTATVTVSDHLGAQDTANVTIVVEDAVIAQADLVSHPEGEVGIQQRPTAGVYVVDEVGQAVPGAGVNLTVSHADLGEMTVTRTETSSEGLVATLLPFDTDSQPGSNVEGEHELVVEVTRESGLDATPGVLVDRSRIGYEVTGPLSG
ncbi:hypothetical protein BRD56_08935 [Thermoplasmatales archaeon SW_10_69_26]|nr:MAG: hypothetical protein BRD56_08935 [Thermoplasmatales archaeon SW_10_69_26]